MNFKTFRNFLTAAVLALATSVAGAQTPDKAITARAAVADLAPMKQYYEIRNFRIGGKYDLARPESWANGGEGGTTLESLGAGPLRVAYIAVGTPIKNGKGEIINAVIISSYYSADSTNMYNFWYEGRPGNGFSGGPIVGPGRIIDTNKFYVVFLDALGLWGASKPSDGLGVKFPQYNYFDMVQANYRLLRDHLNVGEVALATGCSMGGSQTYAWGVLHSGSGFVKAIMPIGGTSQAAGEDPLTEWVFQLMTAAIQGDPVWQKTKGNYYHLPKDQHPNQGVMFGWSILGHTGFDFNFRANQPWSTVEKEVFYWNPKGNESANLKPKAKDFDAVDLVYRNNAEFPLNMNKELANIKARTLVVHIENDQWLVSPKARASAAKKWGAGYASFSDPLSHYAVFKALNVLKDKVEPFIQDQWVASSGTGAGSAAPAAGGAGKPAGLSK